METEAARLIDYASRISRHHMEIANLTGELFNIFSILRMESSEVGTHSRLLAELLNPNGCHNLGDIFLKLFVEQLHIEPFDTKSANARAEVYIGRKTNESGGRLDILITDSASRKIVIENKIYAGDQENQLLRYWNYDKKAHLFYLTLHGDEPSETSTGGPIVGLPEKSYTCLSYDRDILSWLPKCRNEAAQLPILRETLTQYINLLKTLTDQNLTTKMNNALLDTVLNSRENLEGFFALTNVQDALYLRILDKLEVDLKTLAEKHNLALEYTLDRHSRWTGFFFRNDQLTQRNLKLGFEFQEKWTQNLEFGFQYVDLSLKHIAPSSLKSAFEDRFTAVQASDWWPCYTFWQEWRYWNHPQYKDLYFGTFVKSLEEKLAELIQIFSRAVSEEPNA